MFKIICTLHFQNKCFNDDQYLIIMLYNNYTRYIVGHFNKPLESFGKRKKMVEF